MMKLAALVVLGSVLVAGCAEEAAVSTAQAPVAEEGQSKASAKEPQLSVNPDYKGG
jgi:hypothetical protein